MPMRRKRKAKASPKTSPGSSKGSTTGSDKSSSSGSDKSSPSGSDKSSPSGSDKSSPSGSDKSSPSGSESPSGSGSTSESGQSSLAGSCFSSLPGSSGSDIVDSSGSSRSGSKKGSRPGSKKKSSSSGSLAGSSTVAGSSPRDSPGSPGPDYREPCDPYSLAEQPGQDYLEFSRNTSDYTEEPPTEEETRRIQEVANELHSKLILNSEYEKLYDFLETKLTLYGWKREMRKILRRVKIEEGGNITFDKLLRSVQERGKMLIPVDIKREMIRRIHESLTVEIMDVNNDEEDEIGSHSASKASSADMILT